MGIEIKRATAHDQSAIAAITAATGLFPPDMTADLMAPAEAGAPDVWLVTSGGQGFCYAEPERMTEGTWNMRAIGVLPDEQGTGVGVALIAQCERDVAAAGGRLLLIDTLDIPDFAGQRAFYTNRGYVQQAVIPDFFEPGAGKVTFTKKL